MLKNKGVTGLGISDNVLEGFVYLQKNYDLCTRK